MEKALEFNIANYKISMKKKLGSGAFGDIFLGVNTRTNEEVAIKIESAKNKSPQLQNETKILKYLEGEVGIPSLYYSCMTSEYNFMVMDLLGPSLDELFTLCKKTFDLMTVVMIADQMVSHY